MFQIKVVEKIKTHILCSVTFFDGRSVYVMTWTNIIKPDRPHMTKWRIRIACCSPKATNKDSEYIIKRNAFPR
jgi:hypothetical protein